MPNSLYYGDNLQVLRDHIPDESVDLVYLDPPFNSNASYNVLFREKSGEESPAQIKAFTDTWEWTLETERTFEEDIILNPGTPPAVKEMITAFRDFIGRNAMMAYLVMMTPRLVELRRVLKPTGSLYLHCDPTASHYLKIVLDTVFGTGNFRNEIVWKRTSAHSDVAQGARHMGRIHDVLLRYSKGTNPTWNTVYVPYESEYIESVYRYVDESGRRYQTQPLHAAKPGGDTLYEWKGKYPPSGRYWAYSRENMERLDAEGRIPQKQGLGDPSPTSSILDEMPWCAYAGNVWMMYILSYFVPSQANASATPPRNPRPSSNASSRPLPTRATWFSTPSAAVAPPWLPPRSSTASGSA